MFLGLNKKDEDFRNPKQKRCGEGPSELTFIRSNDKKVAQDSNLGSKQFSNLLRQEIKQSYELSY